MKNLIALFVVVLSMNTTFVSANNSNAKVDLPKAVKKVVRLLETTRFDVELEKEVVVKVQVKINSDDEIVVLNVGTDNDAIKKFISEKLNYKKIDAGQLKQGSEYSFYVTFKPE
jgi:predicted transcriptional regulator